MMIRRRDVLKGVGALGLTGILAARQAPAFAQGTRVHLLYRVDFIPAGEAELKRQLAEYGKQMKLDITLETINENELQPRITTAISSGAGPDVIQMLHNWPHLYASALADVADLCEWKEQDQGKYYPNSELAARDGGRWLAVPHAITPALVAYRKSWFAEVGAAEPPKALDQYRKIGALLKKKGRPLGQTLGHTVNDAPAWSYPLTWTFGGAETDPTGKKVVLDSPGTLEGVRWMVGAWNEAYDEGGLAWDDTNNNRAFLAGSIAATLNGASIYIAAKRKPELKTDTGQPLWTDIAHFRIPDGPHGPTPGYHVTYSHAVMKYSPNQPAARALLKWLNEKAQFERWFELESGYAIGATAFWENHKMWQTLDDAMKPFRTAVRGSRMLGYAGPPNAKATQAYTKYLLTDMYAKAAQGMAPADAVRWTGGELRKVYEA